MSIGEFETLLGMARTDFRNALRCGASINESKIIAKEALYDCCSTFEEETMCENLREILVEEYGLV